jgi:hypothetical protein
MSQEAANENSEPTSVWALAWRIIRNPKLLAAILALFLVAYIALRLAGHDVLPPLLGKLGLNTFPNSINISQTNAIPKSMDITGKWEYESDVINKGNKPGSTCGWGGTVEITMQPVQYGVEFKLVGQRKWVKELDRSGVIKKRGLNPSYGWQSDWGGITSERSIKLTYAITTSETVIQGLISGNLDSPLDLDGRPQKISATFFQMSPNSPLFGRTLFRRMTSDDDYDYDGFDNN